MPKKSQVNKKQTSVNDHVSGLIHSPAWKYFKEEAKDEMERLLREILNVTPAHDAEKKYTERDVMAIKFNMIKHFLNFPLDILYIPYRDAPDEIKEEDLENAGLEKEEGYTPVDDFDPYH